MNNHQHHQAKHQNIFGAQKLGAELEAAAKGLESSKNETAQLKKERDELRQQVKLPKNMFKP